MLSAMDSPKDRHIPIVSRAIVLARSGAFSTWEEVQAALTAEGFEAAHNALKGYSGPIIPYPWEASDA